MKKRVVNYLVLLMVLVLPIVIYAASLTTYGEAVTKANNYINSYGDRRKYLLFNKNYVYEKNGFGDSSSFTNGGMLSKSEYDLSVYMNQSYLSSGKEYWTLSSIDSSKYYIDAYLQTKNPNSNSGTRVTEYIKPSTVIEGKGTYANPWTFEEGIEIDIISNNTNYGTVSPLGAQYVKPGSTVRYTLTPSNGYFYNGTKDECHLVKDGVNKYENYYLIQNASKDIKCTAIFDLKTYKFDLLLDPTSTDFDGNPKTYTTNPNPNPIYYKYKTNWYSNAEATTVINSITPPTMTGWTFNGYYYGDVKVIDSNGNILINNLNLGSTNDLVDTDHVLYSQESLLGFNRNTYSITYNLDGGSWPASANHPTTATYDQEVNIDYPVKAGYDFIGWRHNGNSSTARLRDLNSNSIQNFTANSTVTMSKKFANLTPILGGNVTFTAVWSSCAAGTYNDGSSYSCMTCPAGSYNTTAGQTSCTTCPDGYYCTGGTNKTACAAGKEGTGTGKTTESEGCSNCAAGYYAANEGTATCSQCSAGSYNTTEGQTSCTTCPDGYYCTGGTNKTACAIGSYAAGTGNTGCTVCANGKTTSSTGTTAASSCTDCSNKAGVSTWTTPTWSANSVSNSCTINACLAGYSLSNNACTACSNNSHVATWSSGCTIATCASGYNLVSNACVISNPYGSYHCANSNAGSAPYVFTYTGNCTREGSSSSWKFKFTTSGTLTVNSNLNVDVFLVGGGGGGGGGGIDWDSGTKCSGAWLENYAYGGGGGAGGARVTVSNITLSSGSHTLTIGAGGASETNGSATSMTKCNKNTTCSAAGGNRGVGRTAGSGTSYSTGGGSGTSGKCNAGSSGGYEFGGSSGTIYGGSGGAGCGMHFCQCSNGYYCVGKNSGTGCYPNGCSGGSGGGGKGGNCTGCGGSSITNGGNGTANTGGGGGGGSVQMTGGNKTSTPGGSGGSGVIIIRKHQ